MIRFLLAGLLLVVSSQLSAQTVCPKCGRVHNVSTLPPNQNPSVLSGQAVAQARANYLAQGGRRLYRAVGGHPGRNHPVPHFSSVGSFEGSGMTSRRFQARNLVPTCRPSGRSGAADDNSRRLVGDASATGPDGTYRVRIWGTPSGGARLYQPTRRFRLFRR